MEDEKLSLDSFKVGDAVYIKTNNGSIKEFLGYIVKKENNYINLAVTSKITFFDKIFPDNIQSEYIKEIKLINIEEGK